MKGEGWGFEGWGVGAEGEGQAGHEGRQTVGRAAACGWKRSIGLVVEEAE